MCKIFVFMVQEVIAHTSKIVNDENLFWLTMIAVAQKIFTQL